MTRKAFKDTGEIGKRYVESYPDGQWGKVGGGLTPHLQEAQVLGWNAPRELAKRAAYYNRDGGHFKAWGEPWTPGYELVEVTIQVVVGLVRHTR